MAVAIAIRTRYFARLRELAGAEVEVTHVSVGATLADAYEAVREKHPTLPERAAVRGVINQEFAEWSAALADGDEVAFVPPVSGGA